MWTVVHRNQFFSPILLQIGSFSMSRYSNQKKNSYSCQNFGARSHGLVTIIFVNKFYKKMMENKIGSKRPLLNLIQNIFFKENSNWVDNCDL